MKRTLRSATTIFSLVAGCMMITACDKELGLKIAVPQTIQTVFLVEPQTGLAYTRIDTFTVNLDSILESQNASIEDVKSIETTSVTLAITDSAGNVLPSANFANVKAININIANPTNGIRLIASADSTEMATYGINNPISKSANDSVPSVDVLDYFVDGIFGLGQSVQLRAPTLNPQYVRSTIIVTVNIEY